MRVLIIAPPNDFRGVKKRYSMENRIVPLTLASIGAVLEKEHIVKIIDGLALNLTKEELINEYNVFNPDIVLISAFDRCRWGLDAALELFNSIRCKKGLIWSYYLEILESIMRENKNIDFAVYGDPEFTLEELLSKQNYRGVKGLIYREGKKIIKNKLRELVDINKLPIPARHLLDMDLYRRFPHENKHSKVIDLNVSLGCPYLCTYCINKLIHGKVYRVRDVQLVIKEIKEIISNYKIKELHFMDPVFTLNKNWVRNLCEELKKLNLEWSCQTRADLIDEDLLGKMREAGCFSILYGIESGNQEILNNIKKDLCVEDIEKAVKLTKKAGIETRLSFMIGLPGETPEIVKETVGFIIKLDPDFAQFHRVVAFPGTELYDLRRKFGKVKYLDTREYDLTLNVFVPRGYKDETEVLKMQRYAYKKFYLRFNYFLKILIKPNMWLRCIRALGIFIKIL